MQYSSQEFDDFAKSYNFKHVTSSPRYPQSNGLAERMVKTVKKLITLSPQDPQKALLSYRTTPLSWCGRSPAELLMGRQLRTAIPQCNAQLVPQWTYLKHVREHHQLFKNKQKEAFDKHHRARTQSGIPDNSHVVITSEEKPREGRVIRQDATPRSYLVETSSGTVRRNRLHLNVLPETTTDASSSEVEEFPPHRIQTRSQTGTQILPPLRYRDPEDSA